LRRSKDFAKTDTQPLSLSVVVPIKNEQDNIQSLIDSLAKQNFPPQFFEVILVNDHSDDKTVAIAARILTQYSNFNLLDLPINLNGKKHAIDFGINHAKNSIIVLTDADCTHSNNWLLSISDAFKNQESALIIGPVKLETRKSTFGMMQALEQASLSASTFGACGLGLPFMASSANLAFSKSLLDYNLQMLNPNHVSGDDVFLLHSAKRQGQRVSCNWNVNAQVTTKPVNTPKEFILQHARWASKAPKYKDFFSIIVALIVLIFNALLFILILTTLVNPNLWKLLAIGFGVKLLFDFPLLLIYLTQFKQTSLLKVFLPLQLLYPFYVVITAAVSMLGKVKWK
jgi:cellulose synthase/poly-beta-1,6-N-acetylglucosamine synthase-like glycosyltransferase